MHALEGMELGLKLLTDLVGRALLRVVAKQGELDSVVQQVNLSIWKYSRDFPQEDHC